MSQINSNKIKETEQLLIMNDHSDDDDMCEDSQPIPQDCAVDHDHH